MIREESELHAQGSYLGVSLIWNVEALDFTDRLSNLGLQYGQEHVGRLRFHRDPTLGLPPIPLDRQIDQLPL